MSTGPATPPREQQRAMQSTGEVRAMAELPAHAGIGLAGGFLPPLVALAIAAVVGDLLILSFGEAPSTVFRLLVEGTWGNAYGIGQVLYKTTTLTCTGLAFALAGRAGLFNVGAEGQLAAGGFGAALLGMLLPAGTPALIAVPLCLLAAMLVGAGVGAVPGALRAKFGASEVIVTIMLNFIVLAFLNWIVSAKLHVPETLHTPPIAAGMVPRFADSFAAFRGSAANFTIVFAVLAAVASWWYLFRTRSGYELRAVGLQPDAAEYGGVRVPRVLLVTMCLSGALAGLGGMNFVLGYKGYYEEGFAGGAGFLGIAVALVGRNHPFGILGAALLFATLSQGGLAVNAIVPKQLTDILTAVVILAVATAVPEVQKQLRAAAANVTAAFYRDARKGVS
ncbi:ABC transporter permease [Gemmatimonas sp.]|jgi:simple sugar transport system permease protein|uniref:ABC transporter permease n=1 Tax=Gemmatimonas sp. TaxID=1962908 RepID=UPI0037BE49A1